MKIMFGILTNKSCAEALMRAPLASGLGRLLEERPETIGIFVWPFQCASFNIDQRIDKLISHFRAIESYPALQFHIDEKILLLDLDYISKGVKLILDQPQWFIREGLLTLNLFIDERRIYSISFSFSDINEATLFIGGIQGRNLPDALDIYRQLTKDFYGMRPRDFLIEALRIFANKTGIHRIIAIANSGRYIHHPYFSAGNTVDPKINYNDIWSDRGGIALSNEKFELPSEPQRRDLEKVSSKKRDMYRKRYQMLDVLESKMSVEAGSLHRIKFIDT